MFIDEDDAPELDREWFDKAEIRKGDKLIRKGNNMNKAYNPTVPGVTYRSGAVFTVTQGKGKNKRSLTLPHLSAQTKEQHIGICDTVKRLVGV